MPTWRLAALAGLFALVASGAPDASPAAPVAAAPAVAVPAGGLGRLFEPGAILQDRNGDGHTDFIDVRIVVPDAPAPDEVAAAAALAARLGFESSAMSLPLVFRAGELAAGDRSPRILIGATNPLAPPALAARIRDLGADRGLVAAIDGAIVVAGAAPAGTRAAAEAFASRSPYFWEATGREAGDTFARVTADVGAALRTAGAPARELAIDEIVYEANSAEAVSVVVSGAVARGSAARARASLDALAAQHARGRGTDTLTYASIRRLEVRVRDGETSGSAVFERVGLPARLLAPTTGRRTSGGAVAAPKRFALSNLYTPAGLLGDDNGDRIADQTETLIVLPSSESRGTLPVRGAPHVASRIGLESTGISLPLVKLDTDIEQPSREPSLVLFGSGNRFTEQLRRTGRIAEAPKPGTGRIEVVSAAFGSAPAVVVSGGDEAGGEAAADYLARRLPHVWNIRRGEPTLDDVATRVGALIDGRTAAGQAALALGGLDRILDSLDEEALDSIDVQAFLEQRSPALETFLADAVRQRIKAGRVSVSSLGLRDPVTVFTDKPALDWEVDRFWKTFRAALPRITRGAAATVDVRLSEPIEVRRDIEKAIRAELAAAGAASADVRVVSAYKQGLSWLQDVVVPALQGKPVARIEIGWRPKAVDTARPFVFHDEPARWLSELYPADDVLARSLSVPLSAIEFVRRDSGAEIYDLTATDRSGRVIFRDAFSPATYERPWFEAFPDKARATVTTGWISLKSGGDVIVSERVPTDPDLIWDYYQSTALKQIADHIKAATGGKPTQDKQPFFHTLRFELKASEPDYRLGVDEELVSSLESLHDSVYYDGLEFFNYLVEAAQGDAPSPRSGAPGNILPWIHPNRPGQAPELIVTYSDNASREPKLVVTWRTRDGRSHTETARFAPVRLPAPSAYLVEVENGREGVARIGVRVSLDTTAPLARVATLMDNLAHLQEAGLFTDELGVRGASEIALRVDAPDASLIRVRPSRPGAAPMTRAAPPQPGERLVQWERAITPEESDRVAQALGALPGVTAYVGGRSFQGRPVTVIELTAPYDAEIVSRAKLVAWKPVLSIMARQHANELSSTSHVLRLAELLATDPSYQRYLRRMNVVIQPVTNPDGAALAAQLHELTPHHCVHAGRYTALGSDLMTERGNPYTLVTEARVLDKVFDDWLPDVQLNPHGYATHEQVQMFANYKRYRFRSYWIPRGWYTSIQVPEDPAYAAHRAAAFAMRDYIAAEVSADPQVKATNLRIYDRYRRWTTRWQPHAYTLEVYRDTAIYFSRRGGAIDRPADNAALTTFSAGTEAMDEPAAGEWLDLVSRMGFGFLKASVRMIDEADVRLYRREEERQGRITLSVTRPRPLVPGRAAAAEVGATR